MTPMIDLPEKYQNQMSLFLIFLYVSTVFFVLSEICKELIGYFCINNVHIWFTKYQNDIICNQIQLQG